MARIQREIPRRRLARGLVVLACAMAVTVGAASTVLAGVGAPPRTPPPQTASASGASVKVALTSGLIQLGEPTAIDIVVSTSGGRRGPDVRLAAMPVVEGLRFGQPQRIGSRTDLETLRTGRSVSRTSVTYRIVVQALDEGEFSIPPLTLEVDGKAITEPLEAMRLKVAKSIEASQLLYFDRAPLPETVFEGEPYELSLEFGWDAGIRQDGVRLQLPWWGRQDGTLELPTPTMGREIDFPVGSGRGTLKVEQLDVVKRDQRDFVGFRLRRRFVATRPGRLDFSRSIFEFNRLEGQPGMFSRGNVRTYYRPLEPFMVDVLPVPEEGRPFDWTGAVGQIEVARDAPRRDVDAGDVIAFELRYTGDANLEFFDAPDLERIPGFDRLRVLGVKDEKSAYERVVTYDLVPMDASVTEIPPVPLPVFDTELRAYVTVESEPLPIRVRGAPPGGDDPFGGAEAEDDAPAPIVLRDIEPRPETSAPGPLSRQPGGTASGSVPGLAVGLVMVGWVALRRRVRTHGDPASAAARARRRALKQFESELARASGAADQARAFHAFLAARRGGPAEAWIGRARLFDTDTAVASGAESPESEPVAGQGAGLQPSFEGLQKELDRAVFGGSGARIDPGPLRSFARQLVQEGL